MKRVGNIYLPSELNTIFKLAKKSTGNPTYNVTRLHTEDILDFKELSKKLKLNGAIEWSKIKFICVEKSNPFRIMYKVSHQDIELKELHLTGNNRSSWQPPPRAYTSGIPLSSEKFKDLCFLASGSHAVIREEEAASFYCSLLHKD